MLAYLILDLDQTLISLIGQPTDLTNPNLYSLLAEPVIYALKRPGLTQFLQFCQQHFTLVIWSAGSAGYVTATINQIFQGLPPPDLVLNRDHCRTLEDDYDKPIAYLNQFPGFRANLTNTLVIDDRALNFRPNPRNGLLIPAFDGDPEDDALITLASWLLLAKDSPDIRLVDKHLFL